MSLYKQDDNRYQLSVAINTNLKQEIERIHQELNGDKNWSDTVRYLLWIGLRHHYLFNKKKSERIKGESISVDGIFRDNEERQTESGIYISKL